jgi:hypothetical protein
MAIVHELTHAYVQDTANASHQDISPSAAVPVGRCLIAVALSQGGSLPDAGVTDTKGNTWTLVAAIANGTNHAVGLAWCIVTTQLETTDVVTVDWGGNATCRTVYLDEFSGVSDVTPQDGSGSGSGSSTSPSVALSGSTTNADDLIFAVVGFGGGGATSFTPDAGWTETNDVRQVDGTVNRNVASVYQVVSATGTYTASGSIPSSQPWTGVIVALKAAAGGGGSPQTLDVGRRAAAETVHGVALAASGDASLSVGRRAAAEVVEGVALAASGNAGLRVGRWPARSAVQGV